MKRQFHLILIVVNITALLICGLILFLYVINLLVEQTQKRGFADIEQIRCDLTVEPNFQKIALEQSELIPARIIIVDMESNLLADSANRGELIPGKFINASIMEARGTALAGDILKGVRTGELTVSAARKVSLPDRNIIISLSYRIDEERKLIFFFAGFITLLILLILTLTVSVIAYVLKQYRHPIKKLLHHTREAAQGGFSKISIRSADRALNQLAEEFNALVDRYNFLVEEDNRKYSRINTLLSNLQTGILMVDNNLNVTLVNPEAEKLLHLNKLSLFGIRGSKENNSGSLKKILSLIDETKQFILEEESGIVLDIDVEIMTNKYAPYEQTGYLIILRDITEMRRLEKLKDEFVANVSHELRTPLTVISGFVETLKSFDTLDKDDRSLALNIIEVETERLKKLIGELLLLSRIEGEMGQAKKSEIDSDQAVRTVLSTLDPMAKKKSIAPVFEVPEQLPPLKGVQGWFRQIVYNLYDNAIKYSPENSTIFLRLYASDNEFNLEVEDSGPGIPQKERERIFERFYRKPAGSGAEASGNGIGLTITRHMVAEFGGSIEVREAKSGGALFHVKLPVKRTEDEQE